MGSMDSQGLDEVLSTFIVDRNCKGELTVKNTLCVYALPAFLWTASLRFATSPRRGLTSVLFYGGFNNREGAKCIKHYTSLTLQSQNTAVRRLYQITELNTQNGKH